MDPFSPAAAAQDAARSAYYERIAQDSMVALWTRLEALAPPQPVAQGAAHLWRYSQLRPVLLESGRLICAAEAERRVLVLEHPALPGSSRITPMLYGGIQLILPGELAPVHRHSISALRFVLEGEGAYTSVNGEPAPMRPGDFIITPGGAWHDHGHAGQGPVIWLDGLDLGIVTAFNAVFFDRPEPDEGPLTGTPHAAVAGRGLGHGLLPAAADRGGQGSPAFSYPYARTRQALETLARNEAPDPCQGHLLRYLNPVNGDWAMSTLATTIRWLPAGFQSQAYRSTEGAVFSVVEGRGVVHLGQTSIRYEPKDTFVIPGWQWWQLQAEDQSIIFSYSDRAAQEKLGIFREQRG